MTAKILQIRDYKLRQLEREATEIIGRVVQIVRLKGPGGIDDLVIDEVHYHNEPDGGAA